VPELVAELRSGDLVLTLGAGSVSRLGPKLLAALAERRP
jgi:UDP-N-acetylmuramate-alanine ligase